MIDNPQTAPLQPSDGQGVDGAETTAPEGAATPPGDGRTTVPGGAETNERVIATVPTGDMDADIDEVARRAPRDPLPSPEQLNAAMNDGSGNAVSSQPFDIDPADLAEARERIAWDADTDRQE